MASRATGLPYGQLLRSSRSTALVARRPISYTRPLRADAEENKTKEKENTNSKSLSLFSSMRDYLFNKTRPGEKPGRKPKPIQDHVRQGSLGKESIFADEVTGESDTTPSEPGQKGPSQLKDRPLANMQRTLDPSPEARKRWERKMVIREVRKRGRLTKQEVIMATERESLVKSHWFKTSIKKLTPLARQIAGKNIDEAILQMRFSKKKAAKDVLEHLKLAKNTAIVRHGMGLGKAGEEQKAKTEPVTVILKDGSKHTVTDPTSIYIAQAWVNRGPYGTGHDHRARGKINILRLPYTGLSVLLKEEKSRMREWSDREKRALRQRKSMLWVQLPDRPISAQNQYYSW